MRYKAKDTSQSEMKWEREKKTHEEHGQPKNERRQKKTRKDETEDEQNKTRRRKKNFVK